MNDYLDIFNDVIRLVTLQPRTREPHSSVPRLSEPPRERIARTPRKFAARGF